jgi:hypothetical protein
MNARYFKVVHNLKIESITIHPPPIQGIETIKQYNYEIQFTDRKVYIYREG